MAYESDTLRSDYNPNYLILKLILKRYNLRILNYVILKNKKNILL